LPLLFLVGCFVDATGDLQGTSTGDTTSVAGSTGSSANGTSNSVTVGSAMMTTGSTGGGGENSGTGGGGGEGGAPCPGGLDVDGDDRAVVPHHASFDFSDDFGFGAWIYPYADPKFAAGGDQSSVVLRRAESSAERGYVLGIVEYQGQVYPSARVYVDETGCDVSSNVPIPFGVWVHIGATYLRDESGDDLRFWVNGALVDQVDCGDADTPTFTGDLEIGDTAEYTGAGFAGVIDDVFLTNAMPPSVASPLPCAAGVVATFNFDGLSWAASCSGLVSTPAASDPNVYCY
jgi:hypothetical protein